MTGSPGGWTLLLLREGKPVSYRVKLGPWRVLLLLLAVVGGLSLLGIAAGRAWERSRAAGEAAELKGQLAELRSDRGRVAELASRLESIEAGYRQMRRVMGGEVAESERDLLLPLRETGEPRQEADATRRDPRPEAWAWPLARRGFVTRSFGFSPDETPGGHPGLDVAVPSGSYVRAAAAGVVAEAARDSVYGFFVRIAHREGFSSLYAHNSWLFVAPGDTVERLQVIALSGNTGRSTAPHLHLEIARDGQRVDPSRYLPLGR
ncbi:MAG: M23 family metallopeptidase [Gemmatimonadota bacterium]